MKPPKIKFEQVLSSARLQRMLFAAGSLYLTSMFILPLVTSRGDWHYVQAVWDRWQSLNVGILAFGASYIALQISRINTSERNRREFVAARAFMPQALSDLAQYFSELAEVLIEVHAEISADPTDMISARPMRQLPQVPSRVYDALERCVRTAPDEAAEFMAQFLASLQVTQSRSASVVTPSGRQRRTIHIARSVVENIAGVVVLRLQIDLMFPFARNEERALPTQVEVRAVHTALAMLGIHTRELPGLHERSVEALRYFARTSGVSLIGEGADGAPS